MLDGQGIESGGLGMYAIEFKLISDDILNVFPIATSLFHHTTGKVLRVTVKIRLSTCYKHADP